MSLLKFNDLGRVPLLHLLLGLAKRLSLIDIVLVLLLQECDPLLHLLRLAGTLSLSVLGDLVILDHVSTLEGLNLIL